jgi:hypothetical protein
VNVIASFEDSVVIEKILTHLNEKAPAHKQPHCLKAGHHRKRTC